MLTKLTVHTFLYTLLMPFFSPAYSQDLSQETGLVFRFTGFEGQKLRNFMKERSRQRTDFSPVSFNGDTMSLACTEASVCYLWLTRKEWLASEAHPASSILAFTLPVNQTTYSGRLTLTPGASATQTSIHLQLEDTYYPGTYAFTQGLNCPVIQGDEDKSLLQGNGDCRLELSPDVKKKLTYKPSVQYMKNQDSIILNFKGPWARHLFTQATTSATDPQDAKRLRAQLGPSFYCWNLDPKGEQPYIDEPYVCQGNFTQQHSVPLRFTEQGTLKGEKDFSFSLSPALKNGLLEDLELRLHMDGQEWAISNCPNYGKGPGFGQCGALYDLKIGSDKYPIANTVQGVAVGWGVVQ